MGGAFQEQYRRRPQYVAGRAMASQRAMPLDPGPGTQTSFATLRIFAGPPYENPYGGTPFANLLPSVHNYDSGGALSMLADVASSQQYGFID